ncbi:MAG: CPBP family intramembrane metalloprotease [Hyphomicrobium sp.]|nr:CPBP family intramembrane metalloprotease [Hyphomicrobium sp.]
MSTATKSIIYLAIAYAVTWGIVIAGWSQGLHQGDPQIAVAVLAVSMIGPTVAALICMIAFEKGQRVKALGLGGRWSWWWPIAWLAPIAIGAGSVALTFALSDRTYVDIGQAAAAAAAAQGQDLSQVPAFVTSAPFIIGVGIVIGSLINWLILTFTEELGWRGYLHHLWRPAGFWRASLGTGAVWGFWHAPMIYLFGHNYPDPDDRILGVGLFVIFCMLLSPIMTLIRDRTNSVWSAGLFHGTFNAVGGLTLAVISNPVFPWNGIVGIGGYAALAIGVVIVALLQPHKAAPAQAAATT